MDNPMSNFSFNMMSLVFQVRDWFRPRSQILQEVDIHVGDQVLDYGCGPGAYVSDTVAMVGRAGKVYALDIHPLAVQRVQGLAQKKGLKNVQTICATCDTGLPDNSLDVVLLYDVFHVLSEPNAVLAELHRVLKPDGKLSFNDHHMDARSIVAGVTGKGLFALEQQGAKTFSFVPQSA